jgi:hypothetical protein
MEKAGFFHCKNIAKIEFFHRKGVKPKKNVPL